jgi:gamma-glutamylcyclotransferase
MKNLMLVLSLENTLNVNFFVEWMQRAKGCRPDKAPMEPLGSGLCPKATLLNISICWLNAGRFTMYYFAYGSNLNWPQMQRRCPSSQFVCVARLPDYHFAIARHSRLRSCGTANVFPAAGDEVWGTVYDVHDADLIILDAFEDGYRREILPVFAFGNGKEPLNTVVYVAEIESNVPLPNVEYKQLIVDGAKHWNLPASYLLMLESIQAAK